MSDDSSSINEFAEYLNKEGCDGKRFADFVLKKAGGTRPHRIFPEVLSDSDSTSFNVHLEKINTPPLEIVSAQQKRLNTDTVAKEIVNDEQPTSEPQNVHAIHSPTRKSGGYKPSDRLRRYSLHRLSNVRQKRMLLKEFENTLQEEDFDPQICSTPMNKRQDTVDNKKPCQVIENKPESICLASSIREPTNSLPLGMSVSISDNLMCCLHKKNDELKKLLDEHINSQRDLNKSNCTNCSNKSITIESPKLQRTYNIEKGKSLGQIILSPVRTTVQESQRQANQTISHETSNKASTNRSCNLTLRSSVIQENKNFTIDKENNSCDKNKISDSVQNIVHLNNLNQSSMPNQQNIVEQNLEDEVVIPETQDCRNRTQNISTSNANDLNTQNRSSIFSQRNKNITRLNNVATPETQNTTRNILNVSTGDRKISEQRNFLNKLSFGSQRSGLIQNNNSNKNSNHTSNINVENDNVLERNNLNNILTDDENESLVEHETYKKDSSGAPLNLASRRLRPRNFRKPEQLNLGIPIAHPLKLETKKVETRSRKQKIPLNKAPNTPINGEKFADEIKNQLVRLTNNEILDLRTRNSLGKVYVSRSTNLTKQRQLNEKQQLLEKEIGIELKNRLLHYVPNEHSRHTFRESLKEQSNTTVELFSVPDVFKDVYMQDKSISLLNTKDCHVDQLRTSDEEVLTVNPVVLINEDIQNKDDSLLNQSIIYNSINAELEVPETQEENTETLTGEKVTNPNLDVLINVDMQNKESPLLNADELQDICTQENNTEIETDEKEVLNINSEVFINASAQDKNEKSSNTDILKNVCSQDKNEILTGNKTDLNQISFIPPKKSSSKITKKTKNKKRHITEEIHDFMKIKQNLKKRPKHNSSKRSLYSKGFSDSEHSDVSSFQNDSIVCTPAKSKADHNGTGSKRVASPKPALKIAASSVSKSTVNDNEIFKKPVVPPLKTKSKTSNPVGLPTKETTLESAQTLRRSKRGHVPLKTTTPYVRMLQELMEKSEKNKRLYSTKTDRQKGSAYTSTYSMNSNESVPIASSTVNTKSKRTNNVIKKNTNLTNKSKQQKLQNQQQTPSLLGDTTNVNSTTKQSIENTNMQLTTISEHHSLLPEDETPTSSRNSHVSNQRVNNVLYECHDELLNERNSNTLTCSKNSNSNMSPLNKIRKDQHSTCSTSTEAKKRKEKSSKNKTSKSNKYDTNIERSHIEFNPVPVNELNSIFDRLKHETIESVESDKNSKTKKCVVRVRRLNLPTVECTPISATVSNTEVQPNVAVTCSSNESPNINAQSDGELLLWLKGFRDMGSSFGTDKIFTEMHWSAADNLMFTDLEGVEYAFYDTEDKVSLGYLRFKPNQIKPLKRAKRYHLHFIVLAGKFKINTNKDQGEFKTGDMIAINIGTRYAIENCGDEIGILMVIKK